jgi:hypothetical protein
MARRNLFDEISDVLCSYAFKINHLGKLNLLNDNIHAEQFYRDLLNLLYGWSLRNLNDIDKNAAGVDLYYEGDKIVIQVSATATKKKIENSIKKIPSKYAGCTFKFVSISKDAENLKKLSYKNESSIIFNKEKDIIDLDSVLGSVESLPIGKLDTVHKLIIEELAFPNPITRKDSILTQVVRSLAKIDQVENELSINSLTFEIDKKISFNNLNNSESLIREYSAYNGSLSKIYSTFDKEGNNQSGKVLRRIRELYLSHQNRTKTDDLFELILREAVQIVQGSGNCNGLYEEDIEFGCRVVVTDAFMKCRIFENPESEKTC